MAKKTITNEIIKWLKKVGWDERPDQRGDGKGSSLSFRYAAGDEHDLYCLVLVNEPDGQDAGMLTLTGTIRLDIPKNKIQEITDICLHFRKDEGNLYFSDIGTLTYIHSRSIDALANGLADVGKELQQMLDGMSKYVTFLAPSIVGIVNGELDIQNAIKNLEEERESMKNANFLESDKITIEHLQKVLSEAGFESSLDDDQDLYVSNEYVEFGTFISLETDKNLLQFHTYAGVKPDVSEADMHGFVNLLNSLIVRPQFYATGSEDEGFLLRGRYFLSTAFGIDTKAFVSALEKFASAFIAGMRQDKEDKFFD